MSRRVALVSAPLPSAPLVSALTEGQQSYKDTLEGLTKKYNYKRYGGTKKHSTKKKRRTKKKTLSAADERLLQEASDLQAKHLKKFDLSNFVKRPRYVRLKGSLKKASPKGSKLVNKRTTLLSLLRKIPDAKKPLVTWL